MSDIKAHDSTCSPSVVHLSTHTQPHGKKMVNLSHDTLLYYEMIVTHTHTHTSIHNNNNNNNNNSLTHSLTGAIARNLSCPAVSQSCILHCAPFGSVNVLAKKNAPMVDCCLGAKYPSMKRNTRHVLPTLLSPSTTTLNSYCLLDILLVCHSVTRSHHSLRQSITINYSLALSITRRMESSGVAGLCDDEVQSLPLSHSLTRSRSHKLTPCRGSDMLLAPILSCQTLTDWM